MQSRKYQWIDPCIHKSKCLLIKAFPHIFSKYLRRLDCQRTVQINFKIRILTQQSLFFDLTDKIQHLLRSSYRK